MFDGYNADAVFYSVYSVKEKTFIFSYTDEGEVADNLAGYFFQRRILVKLGYRRCKSRTYLKQQMAR